jgi:hypothetical protein
MIERVSRSEQRDKSMQESYENIGYVLKQIQELQQQVNQQN